MARDGETTRATLVGAGLQVRWTVPTPGLGIVCDQLVGTIVQQVSDEISSDQLVRLDAATGEVLGEVEGRCE